MAEEIEDDPPNTSQESLEPETESHAESHATKASRTTTEIKSCAANPFFRTSTASGDSEGV
jgi:hypothetical protein